MILIKLLILKHNAKYAHLQPDKGIRFEKTGQGIDTLHDLVKYLFLATNTIKSTTTINKTATIERRDTFIIIVTLSSTTCDRTTVANTITVVLKKAIILYN